MDDGLQPDWSPDGQWIAYWGLPPASRNRELWAIRVSGGQPVRLTNDVALDWNPVWSPDGESLFFGSDRGGPYGLWRVGFDRVSGNALGDPQSIQLPARLAAHFSFSADGSRMVFASVNIEQQVHVADLDATGTLSNSRQITLGSRTWFYLDVSNDGQKLALVSRFPQEDVFVAAADGQGLRQVTNDPGGDRGVRWSPDDRSILFYSSKPGEMAHLFTMAPDGSNRRQLTTGMPSGGTSWTAPEWSPSGRRASTMVLGVNQGFILEADGDGPWRTQAIATVGDGKRYFTPALWLRDESGLIGTLSPGGELAIHRIVSGKFEPLGLSGFALQGGMDWFPDVKRLVAVRGGNIVAVDTASRQSSVLLAAGPRHQLAQPRLTTDGKRLYYVRNTTDSDITMMTMKPE